MIATALLLQIASAVHPPQAEPQPKASVLDQPRSWLLPELAAYELGDSLLLYLVIENSTLDTIKDYFPSPEEPESFPSDYVSVFKDGAKLAYVHPSETHPEPRLQTVLLPGETLTIPVPLDRICRLPNELLGGYQLRLNSDFFYPHRAAGAVYYPGRMGGSEVEFEVRPARTRGSMIEWLEGAGWRSAAEAPALPERLTELATIAGRADLNPPLRARALLALPSHRCSDEIEAQRGRLASDFEPIVALAAIDALPEPLSGEHITALERALEHRDLGVRRAAAKRLAASPLTDATRSKLSVRLDVEKDELLRRFLSPAAGRGDEIDDEEGR